MREIKCNNVTDIVQVCEPKYVDVSNIPSGRCYLKYCLKMVYYDMMVLLLSMLLFHLYRQRASGYCSTFLGLRGSEVGRSITHKC